MAKGREEYGFDPVDFGNVSHKVLELYAQRVKLLGKDVTSLKIEEQRALVEVCIEESLKYYDSDALFSNKRSIHKGSRLREMLFKTVSVLTKQLEAGSFKLAGYEVPFKGGKIDRVDVCALEKDVYVKVIDYKTGKKEFSLTDVYGGLSLQLPVYLSEAMKASKRAYPGKEISPAGLFYYHVDNPIISVKNAKEDVKNEIMKALRPDGLFVENDPVPELFDKNLGASSIVLRAGRSTKTGKLKSYSKCLPKEDIEVLPKYADHVSKKIRKKILDGDITPKPYMLPKSKACSFCPYKPVCRFDIRMPGYDYRRIEDGSDSEMILKMKEALDER